MSKMKKLFNYIFIDEVLTADIEFFKQVAIFSGMSDRSLAKIALIVFKKQYLAGEQIYKERQEANVLYIVKRGEVLVKNRILEKTVEAGDFFGEISLIENRKHDSTVSALKDSELYLIYRVKFDDMVASNAKVGLKIMKNLCSILETRLRCAENALPAPAQPENKQDDNDRNVK